MNTPQLTPDQELAIAMLTEAQHTMLRLFPTLTGFVAFAHNGRAHVATPFFRKDMLLADVPDELQSMSNCLHNLANHTRAEIKEQNKQAADAPSLRVVK